MALTMTVLDKQLAVWKIKSDAMIPLWLLKEEFVSITRTAKELSIVCDQQLIGDHIDELGDAQIYMNWSCLKVIGPLDVTLVGILSNISNILAEAKISIFALSTFDTDYILVNTEQIDNAKLALEENGILFI